MSRISWLIVWCLLNVHVQTDSKRSNTLVHSLTDGVATSLIGCRYAAQFDLTHPLSFISLSVGLIDKQDFCGDRAAAA